MDKVSRKKNVKNFLQIFINAILQIFFRIWSILLLLKCFGYSCEEIFRNFEIFGRKKLNYDAEFGSISLEGRICVITGGTRGIGLETIRYLFKKNISKIITGSSQLNIDSADNEIENFKCKLLSESGLEQYKDRLIIYPLDLGSMDSVVKFAEQICKMETKIDYFFHIILVLTIAP
ncbi:hypothetical protein DERF_001579 [Dermatophagoides farinae]|uniref:Uncharacterized protein n=1 Tax=Dermatophagoides farinae TaxID=6954 RepID=A0A922IAR7_DERFA|nr:hypothetical protein DERF_001579 [Dermatophagoides farinae]